MVFPRSLQRAKYAQNSYLFHNFFPYEYKFLLRLKRSGTGISKSKGRLCLLSSSGGNKLKRQSLISQFSANEGYHELLPPHFDETKKKNCTSERLLKGTGATRAAPGREGSAEFTSGRFNSCGNDKAKLTRFLHFPSPMIKVYITYLTFNFIKSTA